MKSNNERYVLKMNEDAIMRIIGACAANLHGPLDDDLLSRLEDVGGFLCEFMQSVRVEEKIACMPCNEVNLSILGDILKNDRNWS